MTRVYSWFRQEPLLAAILISLSVHFSTAIVSSKFWQPKPQVPPFDTPIELSEVPVPMPPIAKERPATKEEAKKSVPAREREIVETEHTDKAEEDPNARFLSDRNQKAEKEMRSKLTDRFTKATGTGPKAEARADSSTATSGDLEEPVAEDGTIPQKTQAKALKKDWRTLSLQDLSVSGTGGIAGASDDRLSGVEQGERTVLSTREFKYFSYYHRIKDLLRQYWRPSVEKQLYMMYEKGRAVGDSEVTTQLLVLLSENGHIQKISRLTSSGFDEIDEAAIDAFHRAGPFPNPPKGMLDDDGFVRIRWDFILKTEAAPRIQFQSVGNIPR